MIMERFFKKQNKGFEKPQIKQSSSRQRFKVTAQSRQEINRSTYKTFELMQDCKNIMIAVSDFAMQKLSKHANREQLVS